LSEELFPDLLTFEEVTEGIRVAVQSYFLSDQSDHENGQYLWAYRIRITNESDHPAKLVSRHWIITNGRGEKEEVIGEGVVGEQPLIEPGEHYIYTSGCPLGTPSGFMHGSYKMTDTDGKIFSIAIPAFSLDSPYCSTHIN